MEALKTVTALFVVILSLFASPVAAVAGFGAGELILILLIVAVGVLALCALLGFIARKQAS